MAKKHSTEFDNFSLVRGGSLFHLLVRLRLMNPELDPVYLRAAILALVTWLPLLLLSILSGTALVETSSDIQSLADLGNSFNAVREMSFVPFDIRLTIVPLVAAAIIPFIPLTLTVFPLEEIIRKIVGIVF